LRIRGLEGGGRKEAGKKDSKCTAMHSDLPTRSLSKLWPGNRSYY